MTWILNQLKDNKFWTWRSGMFSSTELDRIIEIGQALTSHDGTALGKDTAYRNSRITWLNANEDHAWIYNTLEWNVQTVNKDYFEYDITHIEPLQFTEYDESYAGYYKPHLDIGRNMGGSRKLSFVLQLTDPSNYEGGELKLHYSNEAIVLPKERGKLLFFPSWALHEVTPVTQGQRHSLVGWVAGPNFR